MNLTMGYMPTDLSEDSNSNGGSRSPSVVSESAASTSAWDSFLGRNSLKRGSFTGGLSVTLEEAESKRKWAPVCGHCPMTFASDGSIPHPDVDISAREIDSARKLLETFTSSAPHGGDQDEAGGAGGAAASAGASPKSPRSPSSASSSSMLGEEKLSIDQLQLDELPPSRFSQRPHEQFPHFSISDMTRLELRLVHEQVRVPLLAELRGDEQVHRDTMRQNRERLENATIRNAAKKSAKRRSPDELRLLVRYLKNLEFFGDLSASVMAEVVCSVKLRKFSKGTLLFDKGSAVAGVYAVLRGEVNLEEVAPESPPRASAQGDLPLLRGVKFADDASKTRPASGQSSVADSAAAVRRPASRVAKVIAKKKVVGVTDLFGESTRIYTLEADPSHFYRATAKTSVEVLFLPREEIVPKLLAEAQSQKIAALRDVFPLTRGRQEKDLRAPSRVERGGRKEPLQDLFAFRGIRQGTVLYMQGERHAPDVAKLYFVVHGTVTLKHRGAVMEELSTGALLGDEALRREVYAYTCTVKSEALVALIIPAVDYLTQFPSQRSNSRSDFFEHSSPGRHGDGRDRRPHERGLDSKVLKGSSGPAGGGDAASRRGRLNAADADRRQLQASAGGPAADAAQDGGAGDGARDSASPADYLQQLLHSLRETAKRRQDAEDLMESEWQSLRHKSMPRRVAPIGSFERSSVVESLSCSSRRSGTLSARSRMHASVD